MDWMRLLSPILRILGRATLDTAMRRGPDLIAGKGKPASQMTPAERQQARNTRTLVKKARQAARITRRLR